VYGGNSIIRNQYNLNLPPVTIQDVLNAYQGSILPVPAKKYENLEKVLERITRAAENAVDNNKFKRSSELFEHGARIAFKLGNEEKATKYLERAESVSRGNSGGQKINSPLEV
jgi:hypothetical protein